MPFARRVGVVAIILTACSGPRSEARSDGGVASPHDSIETTSPSPTTEPAPRPSSPSAGSLAPNSEGVGPHRGFVIDHASIDSFGRIPPKALTKARSLHVFYGRLSHGDQLIGGLTMVKKAKGGDYDQTIETFYSSLDPGRETPEWEGATRARLAKVGSAPDVVMWAWSGNVGRPDRGGTDEYVQSTLDKMDKLERDYPKVTFVYFTGPAQTWRGADGYPKHNALIRKFAKDHGKVLFDFEDIDLHSPDGALHADDTDACEWCETWCSNHDCSMLDESVKCVENHHTHCLNDYRKGQALWVLLARLAGWDGH